MFLVQKFASLSEQGWHLQVIVNPCIFFMFNLKKKIMDYCVN